MANLRKVNIGAIRRCDGMGEPAADGDYILVQIQVETESPQLLRLSAGAAALLIAELKGCGVEWFKTHERYVPMYKPTPEAVAESLDSMRKEGLTP